MVVPVAIGLGLGSAALSGVFGARAAGDQRRAAKDSQKQFQQAMALLQQFRERIRQDSLINSLKERAQELLDPRAESTVREALNTQQSVALQNARGAQEQRSARQGTTNSGATQRGFNQLEAENARSRFGIEAQLQQIGGQLGIQASQLGLGPELALTQQLAGLTANQPIFQEGGNQGFAELFGQLGGMGIAGGLGAFNQAAPKTGTG